MEPENSIQDEWNGLSAPFGLGAPHPFGAPQGYFDGFASRMLARLGEEQASLASDEPVLSPLLLSLRTKNPYTVPDGYFEANVAEGFGLAAAPQPVFGKGMPYDLPADYFEGFPAVMTACIAALSPARVVPMTGVAQRGIRWMRVAAAACLVLLLGTAGYFIGRDEAVAEGIPSVAIQLKDLPQSDLEDFVLTDDGGDVTTAASTAEVKAMLEDVPTTDLDAFLAAMPIEDDELFIN